MSPLSKEGGPPCIPHDVSSVEKNAEGPGDGQLESTFTPFPRLPPELRRQIWEYSLSNLTPMLRVRISGGRMSQWPILQVPEPPELGFTYSGIPAIRTLPPSEDSPAELQVCHASREIALQNLTVMGPADLISRNDIVEPIFGHVLAPKLFTVAKEHPRGREQYIKGFITRVQRLSSRIMLPAWLARLVLFHTTSEQTLLLDLGSNRMCVCYDINYFKQRICFESGEHIPHRRRYVVLRLSDIEKWVFGCKIVIGQVPECLRWYHADVGQLYQWEEKCRSGTLYTRYIRLPPSEILYYYIHHLHELLGYNGVSCDVCTRRSKTVASVLLQTFVAIMDGGRCPECGLRVLAEIKQRHPDLSLNDLDILLLTPKPAFEHAPSPPVKILNLSRGPEQIRTI
ncbi:Uu.00g104270.m01.CDS01 [Anthostomella pinea]|uniref:Uu.00g104270.m01.CDS01 n=1 Tax=Anthostomella pinea TaxID=933095 RepID=A0AAI8VDS4_9PEZI|nr:Uu.00g104270.m01.CDS01 [Anthostomella pinea]